MTESEPPKLSREGLAELFRSHLEQEEDPSPQARKRARILEAGTALFESQGYKKTSVGEIARAAGVAKGTVYLYFESKADLLYHAIGRQKLCFLQILEPLFNGELREEERLRFYVGVLLESAREVPLAAKLLRGDGELRAALDELGEARVQENRAMGRGWVAEMIEAAAPGRFDEEEKAARADALLIMGYLSGLLLDDAFRLGRSFDEATKTLADILVYGVVNRAPEREP